MSNQFLQSLRDAEYLHVQQIYEGWELLGLETRNKYRILDQEQKPIAYAAEVSTGFLGTLLRMFLKHWRSFEVHIFDNDRNLVFKARFPFRWFFKSFFLQDASGKQLGELRERFGIFYKKFDLLDPFGREVATIRSPLFKLWTFDVKRNNHKLGSIQKKWSGALSEIFTDKDNFVVNFDHKDLELSLKAFLLATTLMVDIVYFENNQGASLLDLGN